MGLLRARLREQQTINLYNLYVLYAKSKVHYAHSFCSHTRRVVSESSEIMEASAVDLLLRYYRDVHIISTIKQANMSSADLESSPDYEYVGLYPRVFFTSPSILIPLPHFSSMTQQRSQTKSVTPARFFCFSPLLPFSSSRSSPS